MAGEKISALPPIVTPLATDIFPVVQAGVTYKETFTQLSTLFLPLTSLPLAVASGGTGVTTSTGTGSTVLSISPALVTPNIGVATATSLVFSPTTNGIIGTTTNNNAAAGMVGQYIATTVLSGAAVALGSGVTSDVCSIALTAGDWDVVGMVQTSPGAGTTYAGQQVGINTTSATLPTGPAGTNITNNTVAAGGIATYPIATIRMSLAAPTTVYLVANIGFAVSTLAAYGYIAGRRVR